MIIREPSEFLSYGAARKTIRLRSMTAPPGSVRARTDNARKGDATQFEN